MILWELFITFFKIGLFTIGGGYAMIPMITDEVLAHGWAELSTVTDFIAVSESTPGPFAVNIATFLGFNTAGVAGAACATFGVILPSFIIIAIIARFFMAFGSNKHMKRALFGLRPAVVGLILSAGYSIARANLFTGGVEWIGICIAAATFVCLRKFKKIHPGLLMLGAAAVGIVVYGFIL